MNIYILFFGGVILGILLAMTIFQHNRPIHPTIPVNPIDSVFAFIPDINSSNVLQSILSNKLIVKQPAQEVAKTASVPETPSLRSAPVTETKSAAEQSAPSTPFSASSQILAQSFEKAVGSQATSTSPSEPLKVIPQQMVVKWAPGKESTIQKFATATGQSQKPQIPVNSGATLSVGEYTGGGPAGKRKKFRKQGGGNGPIGGGGDFPKILNQHSPIITDSSINPVNITESPINLENQMRFFKQLKKKEKLYTAIVEGSAPNSESIEAIASTVVIDSNLDKFDKSQRSSSSSTGSSTVAGGSVFDSLVKQSPHTISQLAINRTSTTGRYPETLYHKQATRDFKSYTPKTYSYDQVLAEGKPIPDMSRQRGILERENLKIHMCNGVFEAYSAAYLTTKEHMVAVASESFNLSWVNCEMASFIHMKESNRFYKYPNNHGIIIQTLDVIDFSVIHLSAYERSSLKHKNFIWSNEKDRRTQWHDITPVIQAGKALEMLNNPNHSIYQHANTATAKSAAAATTTEASIAASGFTKQSLLQRKLLFQYSPEAKRTVVIMPFLGGAMGAGHSKLNNRFEYLKTCFWSLYEFFPYIVIGVSRQEDVDWGWKESGLPFFDIILITGLPKSAGLPVGLTQQTKKRLVPGGIWADRFDYIFFSESDQILISRELPLMYQHLKKYPGHMILPHRLMPYSPEAITKAHLRDISTIYENGWMNQSCCLERQNCAERKSWRNIKDPLVPIINYYGLYVPLGNVNFLREDYRYCRLGDYVGDYCP